MAMFPTNIVEVRKTDSKLKSKSNTSHDGKNKEINNCCSSVLEPYLVELFKNCLNEEKFPDKMKMAKLVLSFNNGDKHRLENYRAMSLPSSISKISESIICEQMTFFSLSDPFSENKKGFWQNCFCFNAITEAVEPIREQIEKECKVHPYFFDLQKAFDKIDESSFFVSWIDVDLRKGNFHMWKLPSNSYAICYPQQKNIMHETHYHRRSTRLGTGPFLVFNIHQWSAKRLEQCKINSVCW